MLLLDELVALFCLEEANKPILLNFLMSRKAVNFLDGDLHVCLSIDLLLA